jgi:hypothetical protein
MSDLMCTQMSFICFHDKICALGNFHVHMFFLGFFLQMVDFVMQQCSMMSWVGLLHLEEKKKLFRVEFEETYNRAVVHSFNAQLAIYSKIPTIRVLPQNGEKVVYLVT